MSFLDKAQPIKSSFLDKASPVQTVEDPGVGGLKGFSKGVAKGELSTLFGLGKIGTKIGRALLPKFAEPKQPNIYEKEKPEILKPKGTAEKFGFGTEQLAEFFIPSAGVAKLGKGVGLIKRAGLEAATFGGQTAIQQGEFGKEAGNAALFGAAIPFAGRGAKMLKGPVGDILGKASQTKIGSKIPLFKNIGIKKNLQTILETKPNSTVAKYKLSGEGKIVNDPVAKEAIKQGIDEGIVATIKGSSPTDKIKMNKMMDVLEQGKVDPKFAATNRASDIVGNSVLERFAVVNKANQRAGKQLNDVAKGLKGQSIDTTEAVQKFMENLDDLGVTFNKGKAVYSNSQIEGLKEPQKIIDTVVKRMNKVSDDAYEIHNLKRFIDEQVTYGKTSGGLTGRAEGILKGLRNNLDTTLDKTFKQYNNVNTTYSTTRNAIDDFVSSAGTKFDPNLPNANARVGTLMRRILSNAQSRMNVLNAMQNLQDVAMANGGKFTDDVITQVVFVDDLERLFGTQAPTSLAGEVSKGVQKAVGLTGKLKSAGGILELSGQTAAKGVDKLRNINIEGLSNATRNLLKGTDEKIGTKVKGEIPQGSISKRIFGPNEEKVPTIQDVISGRALPDIKAGMSIEDVSKKKVDSGFQGFQDLTTKTIEKLKGKTTVSKQFISDLTNSPDMKQAERDLIRKVLDEMPEGSINATEFANKVKTELLPLKVGKRSTGYESVTLPEATRGRVANYERVTYESPIKTSAGKIHPRLGESENYFAHVGREDMAIETRAPKRLTNGTYEVTGESGTKTFKSAEKALEYQTGSKNVGGTRRVIEIQSDLMQKGALEREGGKHKVFSGNLKDASPDMIRRWDEAEKNVAKLRPYKNTWHERIIKEEIKQAAKDGKTKLQFPTGETAMKIEGLGGSDPVSFAKIRDGGEVNLTIRNMKVGDEILGDDTGIEFIITDVLGEGKFKAISKNGIDNFVSPVKSGEKNLTTFEKFKQLKYDYPETVDRLTEQFDISGKLDTSNKIYRFYEKEVQRYLKRIEPNMKTITDEQGVTWFELPISKEKATEPVTAFGKAKIGALVTGAGVTAPSMISSVISDRTKYKRPKIEGPQEEPSNTPQIAKGLAYAETRGVEKPYTFSQWSNPALGEKSKYGKALGKYQITEARLKEKSKEFLGGVITPKEFLENPSFQEKFIKGQIDWQRSNGLTDEEIIATHRQGWGNMTPEQLKKAVKERGGYIKDVQAGMGDINKIISERAK